MAAVAMPDEDVASRCDSKILQNLLRATQYFAVYLMPASNSESHTLGEGGGRTADDPTSPPRDTWATKEAQSHTMYVESPPKASRYMKRMSEALERIMMVVVKLKVGKFACFPLRFIKTSARSGSYNDDFLRLSI